MVLLDRPRGKRLRGSCVLKTLGLLRLQGHVPVRVHYLCCMAGRTLADRERSVRCRSKSLYMMVSIQEPQTDGKSR